MKIYAPNREFSEFLNFMATKRQDFNDWRFVNIFQINKTAGDFPYEDVLRFIDAFLPEDRPVTVLLLRASRQMLLIGDSQNLEAFYEIEKRVPVSFRALNIHVAQHRLNKEGLDEFSKILTPYLDKGKPEHSVLFTRLLRGVNHMMVVDDNPMVTKQLEKILSDFGRVTVLHTPDLFEETYIQCAPDILFLDIHLRSAMGNELLRDLRKRVDSFAHVIIISSDTEEKMVKDIKLGGAKGFIVKPFTRTNVFQHLSRAPTFIPVTPPQS